MVVAVADTHLIRAAQAGDLAAFELLVDRHGVGVYRVALRMLGNEADAEEAAQDAFVQAWRALDRFRAESAFATWMYRIVTNRCLDALAARRAEEPLDERAETAAPDDLEAVVDGRERWAALVGAIGALSAEQRAALVLREFEGLSYEEIADVLGVTVGAVKGRLHRARLELMQRLTAFERPAGRAA